MMPTHNKEITIEKIACPLHILTLKKGLDVIEKGQTLKVCTGGAHVSGELMAACQTMGHVVEGVADDDRVLFVHKCA